MAKKTTKDLTELGAVLESNGVVLPKGKATKIEDKKDTGDNGDAKLKTFPRLTSANSPFVSREELDRLAINNIVMCGMISDDPDHDAKFRKYKYALEKLYPNATVWNPVTYVPKIKRWMFPFQKLTNDMALIICLRTIYKLSRKDGFMLGILPDCITSLGGMAEWKMGQAMKVKIERMEEVK